MKKLYSFITAIVAILFLKNIPLNLILGSKGAAFSLISIGAPVITAGCGLIGLLLCSISQSLLYKSFLHLFLLRSPLLVGSLYYAYRLRMMGMIAPIVCMILFIMHPEGEQVWYYSLYWLLPFLISFFHMKQYYFQAITTSFLMHAVGSVVWLYLYNISAATWTLLMPIVFVERLLIALGIMIMQAIWNRLHTTQKVVKQRSSGRSKELL